MNVPQELLSRAISLRCSESSYGTRLLRYPQLAELAPAHVGNIVNDSQPWFCHGLGIRLALWRREAAFLRFERAITFAKSLKNFELEWRNNWGSQSLVDYERYFHLLWMLQCAEDLADKGLSVEFTASNMASPDLTVKSPKDGQFFVESYVYSKWWFLENFLNEIMAPFGEDLRIERNFNLPFLGFSSIRDKTEFIEGFMRAINDETRLSDGRCAAKISWPVELHEDRGIRLVVESDNSASYIPRINRHGNPSDSMRIFISEIIRAKKLSNNLQKFKPNLLMVNCLGPDFQFGYDYPIKPDLGDLDFGPIDALLVCSCGIDSSPSQQSWLLHTKLENHPIRNLYVGKPWVSTLEG